MSKKVESLGVIDTNYGFLDAATAELGVVGCILDDVNCVPDVMEVFGNNVNDYILDPLVRLIFDAIWLQIDELASVKYLTIISRLESTAQGKEAIKRLMQVSEAGFKASDVQNYLLVLKERRKRRRAKRLAQMFSQIATDESLNVGEEYAKAIEYATESVLDAKRQSVSHQELYVKVVEDYRKRHGKPDVEDGLWTGWRTERGSKICVPNENDLTIIGARPGKGKTDVAKELALTFSNQGKNGLFLSLEMSSTQVAERLIASEANLDRTYMRFGRLDPDSCERMVETRDASLKKGKILIDDTPGIEAKVLEAKVKQAKIRHNIEYVILDYIQLARVAGVQDKRVEVGKLSGICKRLAGELKIAFIALAQLNRLAADTRPTMAQLKEAGDLEQDASVVWLLHTDIVMGATKVNLKIIQEKHRHLGAREMDFDYHIDTGRILPKSTQPTYKPAPSAVANARAVSGELEEDMPF